MSHNNAIYCGTTKRRKRPTREVKNICNQLPLAHVNGKVAEYENYFANFQTLAVDKYNNTLAHFAAVQDAQVYFPSIPASMYNAANMHGMTPILHLCCYDANVNIVAGIAFQMTSVYDKRWRTPLTLAAKLNQRNMVKHLLQRCQEQNCVREMILGKDKSKRNALQYAACKKSKFSVLEQLLDALHASGSKMNELFVVNHYGQQPLIHHVLPHSEKEIVTLLYNKYHIDGAMIVNYCVQQNIASPVTVLHQLQYQFTEQDWSTSILQCATKVFAYLQTVCTYPVTTRDVEIASKRAIFKWNEMLALLSSEQKQKLAPILFARCNNESNFCTCVNNNVPLPSTLTIMLESWKHEHVKHVYFDEQVISVASLGTHCLFSNRTVIKTSPGQFQAAKTCKFEHIPNGTIALDWHDTLFCSVAKLSLLFHMLLSLIAQ